MQTGSPQELSGSTLSTGLAQSHVPVLDGLRALAVSLVIIYHAGTRAPGGLGVLAFFVISGFIITWLLLKEEASTGTVSLRAFYFRRSLRIFPAFYVYVIIITALAIIRHKLINWPQAIASITYFSDYYQAIYGDPGTGFSHTWSLAVEEQFYLTWPMLFLFLGGRNLNRARWMGVLVIMIWAWRAFLQFVIHVNQGWIYEAFDTRFDHLLIGCILAIILFKRGESRALKFFNSAWVLAVLVALLCASAILEHHFGATYRDSVGFIIDPLVIAALIPALISQRTRLAVRWLDNRVVSYIGIVSYSMYLYQQLLVDPVMKRAPGGPLIKLAVAFAAVLAMASLSYFLVERPFMKLRRRGHPASYAASKTERVALGA